MRTVLVLIFLLLAVYFALENQAPTTVVLGPFAISQSVGIVVISTFIIGVLAGRAITLPSAISKRVSKASG